jgi:hypothetical protein
MGTSLNGLTPAGTYPGLIKTGDNAPIDGTLKTLSDGNGNNLPMAVSTTAVNFTNQLQQSGVAVPTASQVAAKQDTLVSGTNIKTINGTSVLGSGNIAVVTSPSGVSGAIQFSDGSAFASDSANLFWDDTNNRLGIGTNAPLDTINAKGVIRASRTDDTNSHLTMSAEGGFGRITAIGGIGVHLNEASTTVLQVLSGNVTIGNGTTGLGARVGIKGSGSTSATTSLLVQNSAGAASLQVTDDGSVFNYGKNAVTSNTAFGRLALNSNTSGGENTAVGVGAGQALTAGSSNTAIGNGALTSLQSGQRNVAIGVNSMQLTASTAGSNVAIGWRSLVTGNGSGNTAVGTETFAGGFSNSVILGFQATATASNQFVVGSTTYNAGAVATESNSSTKVWNVIINGVAQKILLA